MLQNTFHEVQFVSQKHYKFTTKERVMPKGLAWGNVPSQDICDAITPFYGMFNLLVNRSSP